MDARSAGHPDIAALVQLLRRGRGTEQLQAAGVLERLAFRGVAFQRAIAAAGAVPVLTQLMRSSSVALQGAATLAMVGLVAGSQADIDIVEAFVAGGGLPPMLACLASRSTELHMPAAALAT